ncbi:hypothetical protein N7533_007750 [Penicillium manginii]|uniref:uncharacterized protein n=1 Tax=Penicillium manginii TaxID=203109 RepID=UPI0025469576|nr:uncharacterized protein N7533_007750 [Penicillium manginii]KAJ5750722.1 hypothetical protein N7533_007750 [Penicillium manginii]
MEPGGCRTHNGAHFVGYIPNQNGGIRDCSPRKEQKQMETVQTYVPGASLTSRRGEVVRKVEWERRYAILHPRTTCPQVGTRISLANTLANRPGEMNQP